MQSMDAGLKFTEGSRRAILLAQQEAVTTNGGIIDVEHLLLGLYAGETIAAQALNESVSCAELRAALAGFRPIVAAKQEPKVSRAGKRVLQQAYQQAANLRHSYIGPEHLLLALLQQTRDPSVVVLRRFIALEVLRARVLQLLGCDAKAAEAMKGGAALWWRSPIFLNAVCFLVPFASWGPLFLVTVKIPSRSPAWRDHVAQVLLFSAALAPIIAGFGVVVLLLVSKSQKAKDAGMWLIGGIIAFCLLGRFFIGGY